jgi:hypothetical protein
MWSVVRIRKWKLDFCIYCSEVQYREGGERVFVGKVYRVVSDEK